MQKALCHFLRVHGADADELMGDVTEMGLCCKADRYHYFDCVKQKCDHCGVHLVQEAFQEVVDCHGDKDIVWQAWDVEKATTAAGKATTHTVLKEHSSSYSSFMEVAMICTCINFYILKAIRIKKKNNRNSWL